MIEPDKIAKDLKETCEKIRNMELTMDKLSNEERKLLIYVKTIRRKIKELEEGGNHWNVITVKNKLSKCKCGLIISLFIFVILDVWINIMLNDWKLQDDYLIKINWELLR